MNFLSTFFAIIGVVIGSGFISGKEVAVFFTRFGYWSFPCIVISFFLFFYIFKFLLGLSESSIFKFEKSKIAFVLNFFLCTVFSSSMFAGSIDMAKQQGLLVSIIFIVLLLIVCQRVSKKGIGCLNKLNFLLVPVMTILLVCALAFLLFKGGQLQMPQNEHGSLSILYSMLYVILNSANGGVLIAKLGQSLSCRQKTRVAFLSALVLSVILFIINIVLLARPTVLVKEMPLLELFSGPLRKALSFAIMIGCVTTLLSLIFSLSSSMRGLCKNEYLIFLISVVMPFVLSLLGFGFIVSFLYPLASVVGVWLLGILFFESFFKRADKKIHSSGKDTK